MSIENLQQFAADITKTLGLLESAQIRVAHLDRVFKQAVITHGGQITINPEYVEEASNSSSVLWFGEGAVRLVQANGFISLSHWGRSAEVTEGQDSRFLELLGAYADAYHHEEQCRLQIDCPSSRARNAVDNAKDAYAEAEHLTKQALSRLMARLTQSRDSDSDWVVYNLESRMYYTQYLTMATIQEALRFSKDDAQRLVDRYRREGETGWVCFSREGFK